MADDMYASGFDDAASFGRQATKVAAKGFNPTLTVLVIVVGIVLLFLIGNYVLYAYAQKVIPPRKKKPISKKKLKRERLKAGVMPAGE